MTAIGAIDMHAHYYGGLIDALLTREARPFVRKNIEGRLILHAMTASTDMSDGYTDITARLAYMDAKRIATQMLTFPGALGIDAMPVIDVATPIRAYNDHLATVCRASAGRFVGLAGLPLADCALAAAELRRARLDLGLMGAILPGNYFLSVEAARTLTPLFEAANAAGALLMIHPGLMPGEAPPAPYPDETVLRASALNLQASIAQMALTVVTARLCAAYPRITFHLVNLGGTLPFVLERMEAVALSRPPYSPFDRAALRGMVYDCASLGPRALELAVHIYGADRVMLGTDYPIFTPDQVGDTLEAASLCDDARAQVLWRTAERVMEALAR